MWHGVSIPPSLSVSESGSSYQRAGGTLSGWREMNILFTPLLTNEDCSPSALHNCSFNFSVLIACPGAALLPPLTSSSHHNALWSSWSRGNISSQFKVSITLNGLYSEWKNNANKVSRQNVLIISTLHLRALLCLIRISPSALFRWMESPTSAALITAVLTCGSVTRHDVFPSSRLVIWSSPWPGPSHWGYPCQPDPDPGPGIKRIRNQEKKVRILKLVWNRHVPRHR